MVLRPYFLWEDYVTTWDLHILGNLERNLHCGEEGAPSNAASTTVTPLLAVAKELHSSVSDMSNETPMDQTYPASIHREDNKGRRCEKYARQTSTARAGRNPWPTIGRLDRMMLHPRLTTWMRQMRRGEGIESVESIEQKRGSDIEPRSEHNTITQFPKDSN